ncbi:ParB/RepB/Spo0J family partition protein [Kitasatospora purpeofusca]|uniref:ParB/RepB/Spo0J family partition protein n=1 Tax=Kitasatospora purpeofusca TaxID=67352 RepID=UPI002A5A2E6D|nr:ParB/RepB/Spo0J family partition protein [Kitasatospora purpeofusca]MDY0816560.1 ParB/RepB/Spo0J family partition protein [Kitasatospora purpeofusca]
MAKQLKMTQIHANPAQPREYFDEEKMNELIASVRKHGVMNAIEVRRRPQGGYEIVMGERRYRANQKVGNATIKAEIVEVPSDIKAFVRSMAENVNRADMTPLEEGRGYRRILAEDTNEDGSPLTEADVAKSFGKTPRYIKIRLQLLDLIPAVQHHLTHGHIGTAAAHRISELKPENQQAVITKWAQGGEGGKPMDENTLLHFAHQVREQERQPSMFDIAELSEEEKAERIAVQKGTRNKLDQIERVRALLDELAKTPIEDLATALEGQLSTRLEQLERTAKSLQDAKFQIRQAKALADAKEIVTSSEAEAPNLAEPDDEQDQTQPADLDAEFADMLAQVVAEGATPEAEIEVDAPADETSVPVAA